MKTSTNLWVAITSIVLGLITANGVDLGITPDALVDSVMGKSAVQIVIFVAFNFSGIFIKIIGKIKDGSWNWAWLTSDNFQTQALSLISIALAYKFDQVTIGLLVAVLLHVWNFLKHLLQTKFNQVVINNGK